MQQVSLRRMDEGTPDDYAVLNELEDASITALPYRILDALKELEHSLTGYQISRLENLLQSATRAGLDDADIEMVVETFIYDLGVNLGLSNQSQLAAAFIRPCVRSEVACVFEHHRAFEMYYYGDAIGIDQDAREIYRGHRWFDNCKKFCGRSSQMSFDPDYTSYQVEHS